MIFGRENTPGRFFRVSDPSGGAIYHWRALRYRRSLWQPYRDALAGAFRDAGTPPSGGGTLLLFGPSAGHCLPFDWFQKFARVVGCEVDPWARVWFSRRLARSAPATHLEWIDASALLRPDPASGDYRPDLTTPTIEKLVRENSVRGDPPFIFFSGVLGQLPLLHPEATDRPSFIDWQCALTEALRKNGVAAASLHDRLSAPMPLCLPVSDAEVPRSTEELARYFRRPVRFRGKRGHEPIVIQDHLTEALSRGALRSVTHFDWQITPGYHHLMELILL